MRTSTASSATSSSPCFLKAALPLFVLLLALARPVKALVESEEATSLDKRSSLDGIGVPVCAASQDLCPIAPGSDELKCVDLSDLKTCGGCMTDGEGVDCTSVPGYFMHQCTRRGQCSGCRWKRGGMNQSLSEPDYLTCSVILAAPVKPLRPKMPQNATLSYARVGEQLRAKKKPMAARLAHKAELAAAAKDPDSHYADVNGNVRPNAARLAQAKLAGAGTGQLSISAADIQAFGLGLTDVGMSIFNPSHLPQPPTWLVNFISSRLRSLPLSTEDDALLIWLRTLKEPLSLAARQLKPKAAAPEKKAKKKITNAERFKLQLPPVAPKAIDERPNKPAPFRLPGVDYTDEEIEAMGWDDLKKKKSPASTLAEKELENSKIWLQVLIVAIYSNDNAKEMRKDVLESVWQLLDFVAEAEERKISRAMKAAEAKKAKAGKIAAKPADKTADKGVPAVPKKADNAKPAPALVNQVQGNLIEVQEATDGKAPAAKQVAAKAAEPLGDKASTEKKEAPQIAAAPKKEAQKGGDKQKSGPQGNDGNRQQPETPEKAKEATKLDIGTKQKAGTSEQKESKQMILEKGKPAAKPAEKDLAKIADKEKVVGPNGQEKPKEAAAEKAAAPMPKPEAKKVEKVQEAAKKPETPAKQSEEDKAETPKKLQILRDPATPQVNQYETLVEDVAPGTTSESRSDQAEEEPKSDLDMLLGLRAMLDAKEKELSSLRNQIEARLGSLSLPKKADQAVVKAPAQAKKPGVQPALGAIKPKEATHDQHDHEEEAVNAFEEHVRLAKVDQNKKQIAKVQPELSILETEELSAGAAEIKPARPLMAGIAKARPNAHAAAIVPAFKQRE